MDTRVQCRTLALKAGRVWCAEFTVSTAHASEQQCRTLALKAVRACCTESSRCLRLAFRSNSVAWRLTKSLRSRVSEQQCCMDTKVHCRTLALDSLTLFMVLVLVCSLPSVPLFAPTCGRDDWTWGLRFRSSWSWCLCPVSDCRPFVEDYLVAALESDMSSISPRMPRTLTSLAKLDPLSASTGISQISSLLSSGIGFPLDLNYGLRGVFRIRQSFCHRLQHTSRSRIS